MNNIKKSSFSSFCRAVSGEAAKRETYPWKIFISLTDWQTDWLLLLHRRLAPLGTSILFRVFLLATTSRRGTICLLLEVSTTIDYNATDDRRTRAIQQKKREKSACLGAAAARYYCENSTKFSHEKSQATNTADRPASARTLAHGWRIRDNVRLYVCVMTTAKHSRNL